MALRGHNKLTLYGIETRYGGTNLGQHWFVDTWTNPDLLSIGPQGNSKQNIQISIQISVHENVYENVVCEMTIVSMEGVGVGVGWWVG